MKEIVVVEAPQFFKTADFYLATAILSTQRGTLVDVDRTDTRRMKFVFEGVGLDEFENDWNNSADGLSSLRRYVDALRRMKSIIHNSQ